MRPPPVKGQEQPARRPLPCGVPPARPAARHPDVLRDTRVSGPLVRVLNGTSDSLPLCGVRTWQGPKGKAEEASAVCAA